MLRFPFKEIPSHVCAKEHVCMCECHDSAGAWGGGAGLGLEPFQLLMHYRQIGPQIGLFAAD